MVSLVSLLTAPATGLAANWLPYGPDGGDARALATDPSNHAHLYLGTATGWIYDSSDSGAHWKRLARVGKRDDLVLDNMVVDPSNPKHVIVGAWVLSHVDGGIYQSSNGGVTWTASADMQGQSIRSLAESPSDPKTVVAGTLGGIYRSTDSGQHWERISPKDNVEIHNVQSVAIDPLDPETIYAGTWHLPWKTTDGGKNWASIKQGVIDDSDVFSIIVDPKDPNIVFASACSGIYKSENKGERFVKVQGIPSSARRTRVLMQDPTHLETVFAGTTEGLWRSDDLGRTWSRTTGPEVIVNDVLVDPTDSRRVLIATDRGGVLTSDDGGSSFLPANSGFSSRQVTAFLSDSKRSGTLYAGVVNDKEWGGVFVSEDGGLNWVQRSSGLNGRDVFSLGQAPDGGLIAGTGHGIFRLDDGLWMRAADGSPDADRKLVTTPERRGTAALIKTRRIVVNGKVKIVPVAASARSATAAGKGKATPRVSAARKTPGRPTNGRQAAVGGRRMAAKKSVIVAPPVAVAAGAEFDGAVDALVTVGDRMYAGTSHGMLRSDDNGKTWTSVPAMGDAEWRFVAVAHKVVAAASLNGMMLSSDGGDTWSEVPLPPKITQVSAVAVDGRGELWVGAPEGVSLSSDKGMTWQTLRNLYVRNVDSLYYDAATDQVLVTAKGSATIAFAVEVQTRKVTFWDTGWNLRFVRPVGDHLVGATLFDGFVLQPRMVEAKETGGA